MKLFFNTPPKTLSGGPPTHLPMLEEELRKSVTLINYDYGRRKDTETNFEKTFGRFYDLVKLIAKLVFNRPDLIHLNSAADSRAILRDFPFIAITNFFRVPVFIKFHGSFDEEYYGSLTPFIKKLRYYILKKSSGIGVLSKEEKEFYYRTVPITAGKVKVVKNIIKPDFFNVNRNVTEYPTVLFISRCIRQKGVFELLEAIPDVIEKFPETKFIFIGGGEDAEEFDEKTIKMNLGELLIRYDNIDNSKTVKFYESAWTFVFPTHKPEGMPMVVAETMCAGVPIITSRTRFSLSYMTENEHCLFIDPFDSKSISDKIIYLLSNISLRNNLSLNTKKLAHLFTKEIVAGEYLNIYDSILVKE